MRNSWPVGLAWVSPELREQLEIILFSSLFGSLIEGLELFAVESACSNFVSYAGAMRPFDLVIH
jgi:hypothetical protein